MIGAGTETINVDLIQDSHPSLTKIDLSCSLVRAGLGLEQMQDLSLFKEDIGLKQPIIINDYLSPANPRIRYGGANLTATDVQKVRNKLHTLSFPNFVRLG